MKSRKCESFLSSVATPEEAREIGKRVEFCEITWPQCYVMGEPIRLKTTIDDER